MEKIRMTAQNFKTLILALEALPITAPSTIEDRAWLQDLADTTPHGCRIMQFFPET
jgi:hypothetical protein